MTGIFRWSPLHLIPTRAAESGSRPAGEAARTLRLSEHQLDDPQPLEVHPGDKVEVSLHQGRSMRSGYRWVPTGGTIGLGKPNVRYTPDDPHPQALDPGLTTTFTFTVPPTFAFAAPRTASKPVSLRFLETRGPESDQRPLSSHFLSLIVRPR